MCICLPGWFAPSLRGFTFRVWDLVGLTYCSFVGPLGRFAKNTVGCRNEYEYTYTESIPFYKQYLRYIIILVETSRGTNGQTRRKISTRTRTCSYLFLRSVRRPDAFLSVLCLSAGVGRGRQPINGGCRR